MNPLSFTQITVNALVAILLRVELVSCEANAVPFHRYFNRGNGDHFYTSNWSELAGGKNGYVYEGLQCLLPKEGTVRGTIPLHRYFNSKSGDHFYTTNWSALGGGQGSYRYEGVAGHVFSIECECCGRIPLHRYYHGGSGDHFYTTYWTELGQGSGGYKYEGIAGYVYSADGR